MEADPFGSFLRQSVDTDAEMEFGLTEDHRFAMIKCLQISRS
jgi:hypothetical protein